MDKVYILVLLLMIIPILICIKYARKVKSEVASSIVKCLVLMIITILSNGVFVLSDNQLFSYVMEGLYLFSFDVLLIYILQYSQQYTRVFNEVTLFRTGCFVVAGLDGISLLLNVFFHHVFTLKAENYISFQMYHISDKTIFYYLHYGFSYCLMFCIIASFLTKIVQISDFYRKKYVPIFGVFCVIVILNIVCNISGFPLDISLPFFVFASILICYLTLYRSPKELIDKTLSIVVAGMNNAVICFDINGECVYANDHARSIFHDLSNDIAGFSEQVQNWLCGHDFDNRDCVEWSAQRTIDNEIHYFDIEYRKIFAKKGEYIGFFLNLIDTTEKRLAYEKEKYLATHDTLTGLYNKDYFSVKVAEVLKEKTDEDWLLVCSNIKDFKLINDLFGIEKGNEVLKMQADIFKEQCSEGVIHGRIGGDKFAMCVPKPQFLEQNFMNMVQTMRHAFDNDIYHLYMYIGVYEITDRDEDVSIMCDKANLAMKTLYENYDKSIAYYSDVILDKTIEEKQLVGDFDEAIAKRQFCMYLQPQMTSEGKMIGAEALVRWQHPKRGLIFPGDFIEIFERTGLIYRLDRFVWELAVEKLAQWQKNGRDDLYISVNISTKDFVIWMFIRPSHLLWKSIKLCHQL